MDLVEFFTARLDELARVGEQGAIQPGLGDEVPVSVLDDDYKHETLTVDPAWLLADIAAKREIIDRLRTLRIPGFHSSSHVVIGAEGALLDVVRLLALAFADHPDYRSEWAP